MSGDIRRATASDPGSAVARIAWLDAARVAAIIAVISIHVVAPLLGERTLPESWWFGNAVDSASRWAVPVFVMLSGALLLHSSLADDPRRFYRRRMTRILPPLVAWSGIYLIYGHVTANNPGTLKDAAVAVLSGRPYFHLPFLYLIAGLYVIAPFLRPLVLHSERRLLPAAVIVFMVLGVVDDGLMIWAGTGSLNALTLFLPYVGYFLAGAWIMETVPTSRRIVTAGLVASLSVLATAVGTNLLIERFGLAKGLYLYEYLSVTTVPASLAVGALFTWCGPALMPMLGRLPARVLSVVAASTLGIYVVHPLVIRWFATIGLDARSFFVPIAVVVTVLATLLLSLAVVLVLQRLPILRRLV